MNPLLAQSGHSNLMSVVIARKDPVARVALVHEMLKLARELDADVVDAKRQ
ncbi:MAG TPA: hypothetical protein VF852_10885 [Pseudolabrys sp.]|jgi:hypothetical protein